MLSARVLCQHTSRRLLPPLASSSSSSSLSSDCGAALHHRFIYTSDNSNWSNLRAGPSKEATTIALVWRRPTATSFSAGGRARALATTIRWQSSSTNGVGDSLSKRAARALGANKKSGKAAPAPAAEEVATTKKGAEKEAETAGGSGADDDEVGVGAASAAGEERVEGVASAQPAAAAPSTAPTSPSHPSPPPQPPSPPQPPHQAGQAPPHPPQSTHVHLHEFAPRIVVCGVGGAGGNAVNNMIARGLSGVDFLALNTDAQHLSTSLTDNRLQIGTSLTSGLGCGANPDAGRLAAEESRDHIADLLGDAHMVFVAAGMGGGTGTGAAPVVAEVCYNLGILTVGVVTKPFRFEGTHRMRLADEGIRRLSEVVDTLILVPNQNLFKLAADKTSFVDAFAMADDVLLAGVKSITDLMTTPGLINLDFADVQSVMHGMGNAMLGTGQACLGDEDVLADEDRASIAAERALTNPLLGDDVDVGSAKGMLVNITGGRDMTLFEVDRAAQLVTERVRDPDANIIFGSAYDEALEGCIRVSVVATGIEKMGEEGGGSGSSAGGET